MKGIYFSEFMDAASIKLIVYSTLGFLSQ